MRCFPGTARQGRCMSPRHCYITSLILKFSQHGQVIAAYGKNFAKTKALDPKFHRWMRDGFDKRITGDYGVDTGIEDEIVATMINQAREFLLAAQKYLKEKE